MILTECVNEKCNEPILYPYEAGQEPFGKGVFARVICEKCGTPAFVERISFGGETLTEEVFKERAKVDNIEKSKL